MVVDAETKLLLIRRLVPYSNIVVGCCFPPVWGEYIRKRVAVDHCASRRVNTIRRNRIVQESIPNKSGACLPCCGWIKDSAHRGGTIRRRSENSIALSG